MAGRRCDLCNEGRDCVLKVIGDKEYDIRRLEGVGLN
jgi:hypothetical protein